jgi:ubiquinone/menaquinone biosynthesis C-methylase UbiE
MSKLKSVIKRNLLQILPYNEQKYWNKRSDPNTIRGWFSEFRKLTIEYIKKNVAEAESILELGPGRGRTLEAYNSQQKIRGYDISSLYSEQLMQRAKILNLNIRLDIAESVSSFFPYVENKFDVGVSCQVFLHQRPENIVHVMSEMARVCNKVVTVTGGYSSNRLLARHVFSHDYPTICAKLDCEMNHVIAYPPHIYFSYMKNSAVTYYNAK